MPSKSKTFFAFWALIFVVLMGLNACQGQSATFMPTPAVSPSPTIRHDTLTPSPTGTPLPQTATPTLEMVKPSDTPTKNNCPIFLEELPGDAQLSGTIMLFHDGVREFIDLKTGNQIHSTKGTGQTYRPDSSPFDYVWRPDSAPRVSPNGKWLADLKGYGTGYSSIELTSTDNWKRIISKYMFWYPGGAWGWVNNDTLYVTEPNHQYGKPDRGWLFNPFSSEIKAFPMDYPHLEVGDEKIGKKELRFRYSPDLTRLAYYSWEGVTLWDEENQTALGEFPCFYCYAQYDFDLPIWRSDSEQWLYIGESLASWGKPQGDVRAQIVIRDRDGNLVAQTPQDFFRINALAWSSDGNKVAFVYHGAEKTPSSLGIWDVSSGQMMLDCVQLADLFYLLTWSPDGEYLAIGRCDGSCAKKREVLLMNVKDGWVAHWMDEDYYVEAWIDKGQ